jgi:hypothetical protein
MKVEEFMHKFLVMPEEEREKVGRALWNMFSPISITTMLNFQNNWNDNKAYEEFKIAQNKEFETCIRCKMTELGTMIRKNLGMESFDLDKIFITAI